MVSIFQQYMHIYSVHAVLWSIRCKNSILWWLFVTKSTIGHKSHFSQNFTFYSCGYVVEGIPSLITSYPQMPLQVSCHQTLERSTTALILCQGVFCTPVPQQVKALFLCAAPSEICFSVNSWWETFISISVHDGPWYDNGMLHWSYITAVIPHIHSLTLTVTFSAKI